MLQENPGDPPIEENAKEEEELIRQPPKFPYLVEVLCNNFYHTLVSF